MASASGASLRSRSSWRASSDRLRAWPERTGPLVDMRGGYGDLRPPTADERQCFLRERKPVAVAALPNDHPLLHRLSLAGVERGSVSGGHQPGHAVPWKLEDQTAAPAHGEDPPINLQC